MHGVLAAAERQAIADHCVGKFRMAGRNGRPRMTYATISPAVQHTIRIMLAAYVSGPEEAADVTHKVALNWATDEGFYRGVCGDFPGTFVDKGTRTYWEPITNGMRKFACAYVVQGLGWALREANRLQRAAA